MPSPTAERQTHDSTAARGACAWLLPLADWRMHWPALAPLVPASAHRRFAGIRHPARRRDRLLAAALHRWVLGDALGLAPDRVPLYRSDSGQPRLALPGWHTSLAHAGEAVAVALCEAGPVGVDVEMRDTPSLRPIVDLVCTPAEARALRAGDGDLDAGLLALWVRKEALLKAAGVGLSRPMHGFAAPVGERVVLRDAGGATLALVAHHCAGHADVEAAIAAPAGLAPRWIPTIP